MVVGSGGCQRILAALTRRVGILIGVEFFLERSLWPVLFPSLGKRTLYANLASNQANTARSVRMDRAGFLVPLINSLVCQRWFFLFCVLRRIVVMSAGRARRTTSATRVRARRCPSRHDELQQLWRTSHRRRTAARD